jgi:hypothetical protein
VNAQQRQDDMRRAMVPMLLVKTSIIRDLLDDFDGTIQAGNWKGAALSLDEAHSHVDVAMTDLAHILPHDVLMEINREQFAERFGLDPAQIRMVESGDQLADMIQKNILNVEED